jgi:hypothetical protein
MFRFSLSRARRALIGALVIQAFAAPLQIHAATGNAGKPTISGSPATTDTVGTAYTFTPASNVSNDTGAHFGIQNKPAWASFDRETGRLSGVPKQAGVTSGIRISVHYRHESAALPAFAIKVNAAGPPTPANTPPTISGQPATSINSGSVYRFTPTAADANGDKLTFSIVGKPAWATFSTTAGTLSGTPEAANVGTYAGIVIAVSDGKATTSLPKFSIAVNQVSNGSASLNWMPPTRNTDGSTIANLAGYHIHYGTQSGALTQSVQVANPGVASFTVTNLSSGTWFFGVSAYTTAGEESAVSALASKTIQ